MKRINEILKLIKFFKKNTSNRGVYESVAFYISTFVVAIHFCNVVLHFDVVVVGLLWALFAKVATGLLFLYRRLIWYMEISELTEPSDIDFSLVGLTFQASIRLGKGFFTSTGTGAAVGLAVISAVGYELNEGREAVKKLTGMLEKSHDSLVLEKNARREDLETFHKKACEKDDIIASLNRELLKRDLGQKSTTVTSEMKSTGWWWPSGKF
jgi:hypothetical protein